jgi:hypothetical protein
VETEQVGPDSSHPFDNIASQEPALRELFMRRVAVVFFLFPLMIGTLVYKIGDQTINSFCQFPELFGFCYSSINFNEKGDSVF